MYEPYYIPQTRAPPRTRKAKHGSSQRRLRSGQRGSSQTRSSRHRDQRPRRVRSSHQVWPSEIVYSQPTRTAWGNKSIRSQHRRDYSQRRSHPRPQPIYPNQREAAFQDYPGSIPEYYDEYVPSDMRTMQYQPTASYPSSTWSSRSAPLSPQRARYHLPGYSGHIQTQQFRFGQSYGRITAQVLHESPYGRFSRNPSMKRTAPSWGPSNVDDMDYSEMYS